MVELVYSGIVSADGYTADATGEFDWTQPDLDVHGFINELERQIGTYLYGRKMYETMVFWETAHQLDGAPGAVRDYTSIWQGADKIVYSTTLQEVTSARTHLERSFDPVAVRQLKKSAASAVSIGGPTLAAAAIAAGLVDVYHLFVTPVTVGGGTPFFPRQLRLDLELVDEHRFESGFVHLQYRPRSR